MGSSEVLEISPRARSTLSASAKFGLISLLAYGFSFTKSLLVAHYFGTSAEMDAFTLAFLVPNLLATLLTGGFAISLVPALAMSEMKGKEERGNTFRAGLLLFGSIACVVAVLLATFSTSTIALVAPGFDGSKRTLAAGLLRWCAALLPLNALYAFCSAENLSRKKYVAVAAAPIISTAISVAVLLLFADTGVRVLAVGLVAGNLFQALAVAWPAWTANPIRRTVHLWTTEVRQLARQQLPLLLISSFGVLNMSVDQFMAGLLPSGSAAALNFANSLNAVVVQSVVMAASWVVFPHLSDLVAAEDHSGLRLKVRQSILEIVLLAIPVAIVIFLLGGTAVRLLFQHGRFDSNSTHQVSTIWLGYTCGLLPFALAIVPVRLLNAMKQNNFLAGLGLAALVMNASLDYVMMKWLGPLGISLSTSLVYLCTSILVFWFVSRLVPGIFERKLWSGILRGLLVCASAGACLLAFRQMFKGQVALLAGGALFGVAVLSIYHWCGLVRLPLRKLRVVPAQ
jgi:putative peptidoglycan lipid II flippase